MRVLLYCLLGFFLCSCAQRYHVIAPEKIAYPAPTNANNGVSVSFKNNVLREAGNRKFARKEFKKDTRLIAVRIVNQRDSSVFVGRDINFLMNGKPLNPLSTSTYMNIMRQQAEFNLFYLLFLPTQFNQIENGRVTSSLPIGLILAPMLVAINWITAENANKAFAKELHANSLIGKEVKKGEFIYGLLPVESAHSVTVEIK